MRNNDQLVATAVSIRQIDISKPYEWSIHFSNPTEDQKDSTNILIPDELKNPILVNIHELKTIISSLGIDDGFKQLIEILNSHPHCLFVINASDVTEELLEHLIDIDRLENLLIMNDTGGGKSVKYVRALRNHGYLSILQVELEAVNRSFEFLPNTDWVLLTGDLKSLKVGEYPFVQFLFDCRQRKIPVWSMQLLSISDLIKHSLITQALSDKDPSKVLGYDILSCPGYELIDSRVTLQNGVSDIHNLVISSQLAAATSTMELAYRMQQLVLLSNERGKRPFWQANFGVESFSEYCEDILGISQNLGSQYLLSIRTVELLKPGFLVGAFDSKKGKKPIVIPGHTRFRDVAKMSKLLISLKAKDKAGFEECVDFIFDAKNSNGDVNNHISRKLKLKSKKVNISIKNSHKGLLIKRIRSFATSLKKGLQSDKYGELDELISKIVELFDEQSKHMSDSSIPERSSVKLNDAPGEQENISRETFLDEVEVDAPDSILPDEDDADDKPTDRYVEGQIKNGKWKKVTLEPEITGLKRPMDILTVSRGVSFVKCAWHGGKDTFCPPIWADIALGSGACGFGCRTCFLMLTFRVMRDPNRPLVYTNYEKMDSDIKKWLLAEYYSYTDPTKVKEKKNEKDPAIRKLINTKIRRKRTYKETIGLGIDCADSLLFEGYTQNLRRIAPIFQSEKSNPLNTQLVLLTKSANTHFLKTIKPKNIIITMSLNPEGIADLWEGKYQDGVRITPPITDRLEALKYAQDLGFETRIRLDPILTPDNWEEQYREFVNEMFELGIKPSFITLGTYREKTHEIDSFREKWGLLPAEIDDFDVSNKKEGTHFHIQGRNEIYSTVETIIKKGYAAGSFQPHISLCKETFSIRKELGLTNMNCNCLRPLKSIDKDQEILDDVPELLEGPLPIS